MWIFNVFLYLCFLFNPPAYDALVSAGATCYVAAPWEPAPQTPPPPCFYSEEK